MMSLKVNNICHSTCNGPGNRLVIWTQGCCFNCPGCFNPETHAINGGVKMKAKDLAQRINDDQSIEGITISGGEPLLQASELLTMIEELSSELTIILYSGFKVNEILADHIKMNVIKRVDVAIMGRYDQTLVHPYMGKEFMVTSDRIDINYFKPRFTVEYAINDNIVTKTGIFKTT